MAKPKNPVRAARQAGRQQIRAAKDNLKATKIKSRTADRVANINAKTAKYTTKPSTTTPKTGVAGGTSTTPYGFKPKDTAPIIKGPSYAPFKSEAAKKKAQQMTADSNRRKAEAAKRQKEAEEKRIKEEAAKKKSKTASKSGGSKGGSNTNFEDKRKETEKRLNGEKKGSSDIKLSEYAELQRQYDEKKSKEQRTPADIEEQKRIARIKADAAFANAKEKARLKRLEEERIAKEKGKSGSSSNNNSSSGSSKPTFDMRFLDMGPKYKKGGSVRKYQYGGNPTRPPQPARPQPARPQPARPQPARPQPARPQPARPQPKLSTNEKLGIKPPGSQPARPATRGTGPLPPQPAPAQRPSVRPRAVPPPRPRLGASKKGGAVKSKVSKTKKGK